jgi:hypothetical protein
MVSAPPAPPDSEIYMTPQLAKRRDGLCPSLLGDGHSSGDPSKPNPMKKSYETSSTFLVATIRELGDVAEELKYITDSVTTFLKELVDEKKKTMDLTSLKFQPKGCTWAMEINPNLGAQDYSIEVVCLAKGTGGSSTTYVVETNLITKNAKDQGSTKLPGFAEAKATFDFTGLAVRKGVVRCEFPEFPEGCKGKAFRDIYQLNARVRTHVY